MKYLNSIDWSGLHKDFKELIQFLLWGFGLIFVFCCGSIHGSRDMEHLIGNDVVNMSRLKSECEKGLPDNQECILLYEYFVVSKDHQ